MMLRVLEEGIYVFVFRQSRRWAMASASFSFSAAHRLPDSSTYTTSGTGEFVISSYHVSTYAGKIYAAWVVENGSH